MRDLYLAGLLIGLVIIGVGVLLWQEKQKKKQKAITDDQLTHWLKFLIRPQSGARQSRGFKRTTASLSEDDYREIRTLFTREMTAEWEEQWTRIYNEFSIRAIQLEQAKRWQAAHPSEELPELLKIVFEREGIQPGTLLQFQPETRKVLDEKTI